MGSTNGFQDADFFGRFLDLARSVTTVAPIVSYRVGVWHLGAGLAASQVRVERMDFGGGGNTEGWKLGVLADTGIPFPRQSRLFFEGRGQYRWIPGTEVGPFTNDTGGSDDTTIMPVVDVDMSHAYLSAGLGARF
jgi:hypothetical protein